jgi:hypothetical protein
MILGMLSASTMALQLVQLVKAFQVLVGVVMGVSETEEVLYGRYLMVLITGPTGVAQNNVNPNILQVSTKTINSKNLIPDLKLLDETTGIISTAIANAEKLPVTPSRGQENISLLQQASKKSSPVSAQFTFTCDSQVPGTILWPGSGSSINMHQSLAARGIVTNTHATQTSPKALSSSAKSRPPFTSAELATVTAHTPKQIGKQTAPVKKSRHRSGKEYLIAARQRREQQENQNYNHPPAPEDEWICEFCEYERIFGTPPEALIRQYEIKDRRVRKQEAERRRLLEKAKMKGRKGKKGSKLAAKNVGAAHDRQPQHQQTQQASSMNPSRSHSQGTQSEGYYEDDYGEEYAQDEALPPQTAPTITRRQDGVPLQAKKRATLQREARHSEQIVS